jgi:hypothetical protein
MFSILSTSAQADLTPNCFKGFFTGYTIGTKSMFDIAVAEMEQGDIVKYFTVYDEMYRFIAKVSDTVTYEVLALKHGDYLECKKLQGNKPLFWRRFYTDKGNQVPGY